MLLGLISDIHADLDGLRRALDLLDRLQVDRILCAGDLAERGQDGDGVIDLLRGRAIPCVKGNHEYLILSKHHAMEQTGSPGGLGFRPLSAASLEYLRGLPDRQKFQFEGKSVLLAHATPWDDFTFVYAESRPALLKRAVREADADVIVLGHTHLPMRVGVGRTMIVNPGSIYPAGSRTCATLTLPGMDLGVYSIESGQPVPDIPDLRIEVG